MMGIQNDGIPVARWLASMLGRDSVCLGASARLLVPGTSYRVMADTIFIIEYNQIVESQRAMQKGCMSKRDLATVILPMRQYYES